MKTNVSQSLLSSPTSVKSLLSLSALRGYLIIFGFLLSASSLASELKSASLESELLGREFKYTIYLPDGYESDDATYPVVYLLHGNRGTENSWFRGADLQVQLDGLIAADEIQPMLVVTPADPRYWWADGYEPVLTSFVEELIPHIDTQYRTEADRTGRAIGGYSAGGFGTANIVLQYPELFAAAAPLSPAVYVPVPPADSSATSQDTFVSSGEFDAGLWERNNWVSFIEGYKASGIIVPFYINTGDHDRFDIAYHAAVFYQALREHQPEFTELRIFDGDHDFAAWGGSIGDALKYMNQFLKD